MRHALIWVAIALWFFIPQFCYAGYTLDLDYACFRANDTISYVEIYASVQRANLLYQTPIPGDSIAADFNVVLEISQQNEIALADTFWARDEVDSLHVEPASGQFFTHVFRMMMKPGAYGLRASLYQYLPEARDVVVDTMRVPIYTLDSLQLSDIELGSRMEKSDGTSRFVKNNIFVVPNPTRFFGTQMPMFYYYIEAYGLSYDSASIDSYTVTRRIVDAETSDPIRPDVVKSYRKAGNSSVIVDGFPVTTIHTGTYTLELTVTDNATGISKMERKKFWCYRKEDYIAGRTLTPEQRYIFQPQGMEGTILDVLDPDSALMWMRYSLTKEELNRVDRLNPDGRRQYLRAYWEERERISRGAANQYFARVAEANRRYGYLKQAGWKTDRGRVFILYGEPNQVTRNYGVAEMPDHEVWQYDQLEGGSIFIFYDKSGFGDLDLVHSTKRGEIFNPNWETLSPSSTIRKTGEPR